jgi:thiol-disulfide isomerase/thioredoxin
MYLPAITKAQKITGIKWSEELSWQQIKETSKRENKYIFLDCYATWCGPCKLMDQQIYTNDTVGDFFNDRFISVRVQMDKTRRDNEWVKQWYADAIVFRKEYRIEGYPSCIYLSPQGDILHKVLGYRTVNEIIADAKSATMPGKVYEDTYAEYDRLVADYRNGIKHFDSMVYMSKTAFKLQEDSLAKQLLDEHTDYVMHLKPKERYTKENIEFWASFILNSSKKRFRFFYKDRNKIDRVMNARGYAQSVVDKTIQNEIVVPFYLTQPGGSAMKEQMSLLDPRKTIEVDTTEANWKSLNIMIMKKFNPKDAKRNTLNARIKWYEKHKNYTAYTKYSLIQLKKYTSDFSKETISGPIINSICWETFLYVTDKKLINGAIRWAEKAIHHNPNSTDLLDTYANLLYKIGRKDDAIQWEQKALNIVMTYPDLKNSIPEFKKIIEKMKKGEPTYLELGAVWNHN